MLDNDFVAGKPLVSSLRQSFGDELTKLARDNQKIVALSADLASSVGLSKFVDQMGSRYVDVGIAEQNLVSVASGIASVGLIPFAASYGAFNPGRNWEQIRTTICLNNQPVKIVASHVGLNVGADGATHQMLEDIALMQSLPNMVVLSPGDAVEARSMAAAMVADDRPNYIRIPRVDLPIYNQANFEFQIGPAYMLRRDNQPMITIISTGSMTGQALLASGELFKKGIASELLHVPTIKPLDKQSILSSVGRTGMVVTIEEHQINGGLGSSVASVILESNVRPSQFLRIGIHDQFGESGTVQDLWRKHRLDVDGLTSQILQLFDN